jgi:ATPase family associated with various cellular activities (AAA)
MTVKLDVTPSADLPISVARQLQIMDVINTKLAENPRQGFCFIGSPGIGKTYMMKSIARAVKENHSLNPTQVRPEIIGVTTLAEWQDANLARVRGETISSIHERMSAKYIRETAERNRNPPVWDSVPQFVSLHFFIDEFDTQPTVSEFSSGKLQTFVNACYEHAPRSREGTDWAFVQLVVSMNKSWSEFEAAYGTHVARRIAEMCVRINFDKAVISEPVPPAPAPTGHVPDAIDLALEGFFHST